jgi:thymidylate synthase
MEKVSYQLCNAVLIYFVPFNGQAAALLTMMVAQVCDLQFDFVIHFG